MRGVIVGAVVVLLALGCKTPASRDKDCQRGVDGAIGLHDGLDREIGDDPAEVPKLRERVTGIYSVAEERCERAQAPSRATILAALKVRGEASTKLLDAEEKRIKKDPNILKRGKKPKGGMFSGAIGPCEEHVKENLKDPKSYEHGSTGVVEDGAFWKVQMSYRAKNSFGAMVLQNQTCWMQGSNVVRTSP